MRWYRHLYVGEQAKKRRFAILQSIRREKFRPGVHVIVPAAGPSNLLDILSAAELFHNRFLKREELLILGVGASYEEALEVAARIVSDLYRQTGGFDLNEFLKKNGQR